MYMSNINSSTWEFIEISLLVISYIYFPLLASLFNLHRPLNCNIDTTHSHTHIRIIDLKLS